MAFTAAQKIAIRSYMGVAFGFYEISSRLESMMDLVGTDATAQAQIEAWLDRLQLVDESLTGDAASAVSATYGSIKKVDEVEFYPAATDGSATATTTMPLVTQGRTLIGRIARALGVSDFLPIGDYFGSRRPMGFTIPMG